MKLFGMVPLLSAKAEKRGRTRAEVNEAAHWLTGQDMSAVELDMTCGGFLSSVPAWNPRAAMITG